MHLQKVEEGCRREEAKRDVTVEWKTGERDATMLYLQMDKGGHEPRSAGSLFEAEKGKETDVPLEPPERNDALLLP